MSSRALIYALRFALIAGAIAFLVYGVDVGALWQHVDIHFLGALVVAQPFVLLAFVCFGERLRILLPGTGLTFGGAFNSFVLATGLNIIVPARLSELAKPIYLASVWRVPASASLPAMVGERSFDVLLVGSLALIALPAGYRSDNVMATLVVLGVLAAFMPWIAAALLKVLPTASSRLFTYLRELIATLARMRQIGRYSYAILLTAFGWAASVASVHVVIGIAGSHPTTIVQSIQIFLLTIIGGMIAVLPAGIGTFQAAAMIGLIGSGFSTEESLILAVFLQIQSMVLASVYAGVVLTSGRFDLTLLKASRPRQKPID